MALFLKIFIINLHLLSLSASSTPNTTLPPTPEIQNKIRVAFSNYYPMTNFNCTNLGTSRMSERCLKLDYLEYYLLELYFSPGLSTEIIKLIAYQTNMTIYPVFFYGDDGEKKWPELYQALANGTMDTISSVFRHNSLRERIYSFSSPLYMVRFSISKDLTVLFKDRIPRL